MIFTSAATSCAESTLASRRPPRDFLYSKLMCWVAFERAVALADHLDAADRVEGWKHAQAEIRAAIETKGWSDRGLVYRYRSHYGLDGDEGTFLLCTFWLAQALAKVGQPARAPSVFERAAAFINDVGLLAEEVDPVSGELLGDLPQAFSHIGLVNAAWAIPEAFRSPASSD